MINTPMNTNETMGPGCRHCDAECERKTDTIIDALSKRMSVRTSLALHGPGMESDAIVRSDVIDDVCDAFKRVIQELEQPCVDGILHHIDDLKQRNDDAIAEETRRRSTAEIVREILCAIKELILLRGIEDPVERMRTLYVRREVLRNAGTLFKMAEAYDRISQADS